MKSAIKEVEQKGKAAKAASRKLAFPSTEVRTLRCLILPKLLLISRINSGCQ